jgi:hypothetical protein
MKQIARTIGTLILSFVTVLILNMVLLVFAMFAAMLAAILLEGAWFFAVLWVFVTGLGIYVAAIGIAMQPWFLLFLYLPVEPVLSLVLTSAITTFMYWRFYRRRTAKVPPLQLLLSFCFEVVICYSRYCDFPALNSGIPEPIAPVLTASRLYYRDSHSYCSGSAYFWKVRLTPTEFAKFKQVLGSQTQLVQQSGDSIKTEFLNAPPYWWKPVLTRRSQVYSSMLRSGDSLDALVLWNSEEETLYLQVERIKRVP